MSLNIIFKFCINIFPCSRRIVNFISFKNLTPLIVSDFTVIFPFKFLLFRISFLRILIVIELSLKSLFISIVGKLMFDEKKMV